MHSYVALSIEKSMVVLCACDSDENGPSHTFLKPRPGMDWVGLVAYQNIHCNELVLIFFFFFLKES